VTAQNYNPRMSVLKPIVHGKSEEVFQAVLNLLQLTNVHTYLHKLNVDMFKDVLGLMEEHVLFSLNVLITLSPQQVIVIR
jgi:hypothetical protein